MASSSGNEPEPPGEVDYATLPRMSASTTGPREDAS